MTEMEKRVLAAKFLNIRKKINAGHRKSKMDTNQGINARSCYKQSQNLTSSFSSHSWRWEWGKNRRNA